MPHSAKLGSVGGKRWLPNTNARLLLWQGAMAIYPASIMPVAVLRPKPCRYSPSCTISTSNVRMARRRLNVYLTMSFPTYLTGSLTIWVISPCLASLLKHISPTPYRRCFSRLKLLSEMSDSEFARWFAALKEDLDRITKTSKFDGDRLVLIHSRLIDLIDFLDPRCMRIALNNSPDSFKLPTADCGFQPLQWGKCQR